MNPPDRAVSPQTPGVPNGSGAAAILAAGIGCFTLALLALAGDYSALFKRILDFYNPTGPLSGVTTTAILVWLLTWSILEWRWRSRTVAVGRISTAAIALLILSLFLTFPPVADLF
jgi:hypothetical protein